MVISYESARSMAGWVCAWGWALAKNLYQAARDC